MSKFMFSVLFIQMVCCQTIQSNSQTSFDLQLLFADFQRSLLNLVDSLKDVSTNLSNYNAMAKENQNSSNITNITNKVEIQWTGNTANVSSNVISGGNFIGKRANDMNTQREKRQWNDNTASVSSNVISGGNFIGKRQLKGNIANIFADVVNGGNFMGKRSPGIQKRQSNGNRVTVVEQVISGGTFIGKKRNLVNLNDKFSEQVNVIDASFDGMFSKCDSTGCVNIMG